MPDERNDLVDSTKILSSIRHRLGANDVIHDFDADLILEINTAFNILTQLGVGPVQGFEITGEEETWDQFLPVNDPRYNMAKTYISSRVRLKFDPPQGSYLVDAIKEDIAELEWRLCIQNDNIFPVD